MADFSFSISNVTDTSAAITVYPGGGYTRYRVFVRLSSVPSDVTYDTTVSASSAFSRTVGGLEPGTGYTANVAGGVGPVGDQWGGGPTLSTGESAPLPPVGPRGWAAPHGAATAAETRAAYAVLQGTSTADGFSHLVWNDLVDKVEEMRAAVGGVWDTVGGAYLTAAACKADAGDTIRAAAYNSVKVNIGNIQSTGIQDVSPGDEITGYHIIHLTDVLNSILSGL